MPDSLDASAVIRRIIAARLMIPEGQLSDDLPIDALGLDSLGFAQVIVTVEQELNHEINEEILSAGVSADMELGSLIHVITMALG